MRAKRDDRPERPAGQCGAFRSDGCYWPEGEYRHRGQVDRMTRAMVAARRGAGFTTEAAANAAEAGGAKSAMPNAERWSRVEHWAMVPSSTSAEEAVKRCGLGYFGPRGEQRHWCGEQWREGSERECEEAGHRPVREAQEVERLVRNAVREMGRTPPPTPPEAEVYEEG